MVSVLKNINTLEKSYIYNHDSRQINVEHKTFHQPSYEAIV
jgi:hypothetical protein